MVRPSFIKSLSVDSDMTIKDWIEEIVWYNPVTIYLRKVGRFILRVIRWIPVLWKQEEWDFGYTYDILKHKILEIRKNIEKDTWHAKECVNQEIQEIDSVLDHLDKFLNWTSYIEIPEPPEDFQRMVPTEDGMYTMEFTDGEHKAYEEANKFEEEHYNAFWNELREHSGNWWT